MTCNILEIIPLLWISIIHFNLTLGVSLQLFSAAADVLRRIGEDGRVIHEFVELGAKAKVAATEAMDAEAALGEIPDEFLDPIQVYISRFFVWLCDKSNWWLSYLIYVMLTLHFSEISMLTWKTWLSFYCSTLWWRIQLFYLLQGSQLIVLSFRGIFLVIVYPFNLPFFISHLFGEAIDFF